MMSFSEPEWSLEEANQTPTIVNRQDDEDEVEEEEDIDEEEEAEIRERRDIFQPADSAETDPTLARRSSVLCENKGLMKGSLLMEDGYCKESWSKGLMSPEVCRIIGGHSYLCNTNGKRICTVSSHLQKPLGDTFCKPGT